VLDCGVVLHLKLGNPQRSTQDHTAHFGPSFLGADPWSQQGWRAVPWDLGSVYDHCVNIWYYTHRQHREPRTLIPGPLTPVKVRAHS